jgi:ubiquinone/menaquinone biosynthesis C-methylase UbiE
MATRTKDPGAVWGSMTRTWNSRGYNRFDIEEAREYAAFAAEVFAPIYPVMARQIDERCGVKEGLCIDIGSGAGHLAIALAKATSLRVCAMDFSGPILAIARENIAREGLAERVRPVAGDVHRMPFREGTASLIVSRGSMRFWRNKPAALREVRRVLKTGGMGYVGGGAGNAELSEEIGRKMAEREPERQTRPFKRSGQRDARRWSEIMKKAGYSRYEIICDDSGFWVFFEK